MRQRFKLDSGARVSTGITGREPPAGAFAVIEKDHHSTLYDDAWMPNMQRARVFALKRLALDSASPFE